MMGAASRYEFNSQYTCIEARSNRSATAISISKSAKEKRPTQSRALKREHLGIDEATDVLSFPIDGREPLPAGLPRQLGDVVLCPAVVGYAWHGPLAHGLLHLLGYEHGPEMEEREEAYAR